MKSEKKEELIKQIDKVLSMLEEMYTFRQFQGIINMINIYKRAKQKVIEGDTKTIFLKGSVRAYIDMYSDYENPIIEELGKAEEQMQEYLSL